MEDVLCHQQNVARPYSCRHSRICGRAVRDSRREKQPQWTYAQNDQQETAASSHKTADHDQPAKEEDSKKNTAAKNGHRVRQKQERTNRQIKYKEKRREKGTVISKTADSKQTQPQQDVLAIGDSVMLDIASYLRQSLPHVTIDGR